MMFFLLKLQCAEIGLQNAHLSSPQHVLALLFYVTYVNKEQSKKSVYYKVWNVKGEGAWGFLFIVKNTGFNKGALCQLCD